MNNQTVKYTNEQLIERFISNLERKNKSTHTLRSFKSTIDKLAQCVTLELATTFDLEDYIDSLKATGCSDTTLNQRISSIKSFYNYMYKSNVIKPNPSDGISTVQLEKKHKTFDLLDVEKYYEIYADTKIDEPIRLAVLISLMSGIRTEEICNLKVDNVDFDKALIHVVQGKGNKTRTVLVSDKLVGMIKSYITKSNIKEGYLILNKQRRQMTPNNLQMRFVTLKRRHGIRDSIHIHSGRHQNATTLIEKGVPIALVSRNLGHANVMITDSVYNHSRPEALKPMINNIW